MRREKLLSLNRKRDEESKTEGQEENQSPRKRTLAEAGEISCVKC